MSTDLQISLEKQISQLESEILQRNADIQNLQEAIATLTAERLGLSRMHSMAMHNGCS
jgi:hypothetical protein